MISDDLDASHVRELLNLEANQTCGFVRVTYVSRQMISTDIAADQHVQFFIPGDTFHTARVIGRCRWFLCGSTEWPGVIPADVELGDAAVLAEKHPAVAREIQSFPQPIS